MFDSKPSLVCSVGTEVAPVRVLPPSAPETPAEPPAPKPRRWLVAAIIAGVLILIALWAASAGIRARRQPVNLVHTATVERQDFVRSLRLAGTVEATQSYIVSAPTLTGGGFTSLVITRLAKAGARVHKGDLLVQFDPQNQLKIALDRQAEFRDLEEQIKKKQAEQEIARAHDETELHQADDAVRAAELETRRNEVVSKIDAEKNLANLDEARARFQQLQQTFQLKRQAARAELRVLEIQRDRARDAMLHAQRNAAQMEIHSPMNGVVVLNPVWKAGGATAAEVLEGDEVRSGQPFMQVMDPETMRVRARVNEADVGILSPGQAAQVRLDAYPDLVLPGRVERVAAIGLVSGMSPKMRSFTTIFSITGNDPKLMPDLSAAIDVELAQVPKALVVPRDALFDDAGGSYVWVKRGASFEREAVKVGVLGDTHCTIVSGVEAGAVVLRNGSRQLPVADRSRRSPVASRQ